MRGFHNSAFNPLTLVVLETAFDEAWWTLKSVGNNTVKPDENWHALYCDLRWKASVIRCNSMMGRWKA